MIIPRLKSFWLVLALWGAPLTPALAQSPVCQFRGAPDALSERPSPLDSVSIGLGGMAGKLCYGRPSARGRTIVGGEHPLGTPWRMGANEPTTLHLPFAARIGGVDVEAGAYSLYAIPELDAWTIVVNGNTNRWGIPISPEVRQEDIGSILVEPSRSSAHVETLTFSFAGEGRSGILTLEWERVRIQVPIVRR
jgi:hypothetical protein